jgi:demethylmenaquinone methyltransferase/2-methoxy-6-polyprenyl-1,4-benzoquinol methylase
LAEVDRKRAAKVGAARLDAGDAPAVQHPLKPADGGFNFGELGHGSGLWRRAFKPARGARHMAKQVNFGDELVTPEEKTRRVGEVFSSVARRYDVMNDLMSGGMHRLWKSRFVDRVKPRSGEAILDMAGGTGDVAFRLAERGALVTVADINPDMLEVGRKRAEDRAIRGLKWQVENAENLSFEDKSFDAYTIVFGIRNVSDIPAALAEAYRVLKRGGRFYCMEFSVSDWPGFARAYETWAENAIPKIGRAVTGDEASYRYLVESIRRFPRPPAFVRMIEDAGFVRCGAEPILGGLVAIHHGWKI